MPSNSKFTINNNGDTSVRVSRSVQDVSDVSQDSIFCTDEDGNTAIRVITAQESLPAADPDSVFGKDTNGNTAMRVVGASGGGGDPVINSLSVTPSTSAQTITPETGVDGFSPVNVSAVDASIDANIVADNIKDGVTILGVTGSVVELNGETKTVIPRVYGQTIYPTSPKNGITEITVNAVTSSIDANIVAGNIKKDVQILGVTGSYEGVAPTGTKSITTNGTHDVAAYEYADVQVPTTVPEIYRVFRVNNGKIENSISTPFLPLPSTATDISDYCYTYAYRNTPASVLSGAIDLSSLTILSGANACYYMFQNCTGITSVDLSSLTTISGNSVCTRMFTNCAGITSVDLSSLTTISGSSACNYMFYGCTEITSVDLSSLTTISGMTACGSMFGGCTGLITAKLNALDTISVQIAPGYATVFSGCTKLESVEFGGLKASTFASRTDQFQYLFDSNTGSQATNGCTVHFPSNFDPSDPNHTFDASTLTGYPTFGGDASYIHVAFDLPATE